MPSDDYIKMSELFDPNFELGELVWRERGTHLFRTASNSSQRLCKAWNKKLAGKQAFTAIDTGGYRYGTVFGKNQLAHRVLWLLHTGEWPRGHIDHINGNKTDNRIANLRDVSPSQNHRNRKINSANTSGAVGVSLFGRTGKWKATITLEGRRVHLGYFDNYEGALIARQRAATANGYIDRQP